MMARAWSRRGVNLTTVFTWLLYIVILAVCWGGWLLGVTAPIVELKAFPALQSEDGAAEMLYGSFAETLEKSTVETLRLLRNSGYYLAYGILLACSIVIPLLKNSVISLVLLRIRWKRLPGMIQCLSAISSYQLVDLFVGLLFVAFCNSECIEARLREGFPFFALYCFVSQATLLALKNSNQSSAENVVTSSAVKDSAARPSQEEAAEEGWATVTVDPGVAVVINPSAPRAADSAASAHAEVAAIEVSGSSAFMNGFALVFLAWAGQHQPILDTAIMLNEICLCRRRLGLGETAEAAALHAQLGPRLVPVLVAFVVVVPLAAALLGLLGALILHFRAWSGKGTSGVWKPGTGGGGDWILDAATYLLPWIWTDVFSLSLVTFLFTVQGDHLRTVVPDGIVLGVQSEWFSGFYAGLGMGAAGFSLKWKMLHAVDHDDDDTDYEAVPTCEADAATAPAALVAEKEEAAGSCAGLYGEEGDDEGTAPLLGSTVELDTGDENVANRTDETNATDATFPDVPNPVPNWHRGRMATPEPQGALGEKRKLVKIQQRANTAPAVLEEEDVRDDDPWATPKAASATYSGGDLAEEALPQNLAVPSDAPLCEDGNLSAAAVLAPSVPGGVGEIGEVATSGSSSLAPSNVASLKDDRKEVVEQANVRTDVRAVGSTTPMGMRQGSGETPSSLDAAERESVQTDPMAVRCTPAPPRGLRQGYAETASSLDSGAVKKLPLTGCDGDTEARHIGGSTSSKGGDQVAKNKSADRRPRGSGTLSRISWLVRHPVFRLKAVTWGIWAACYFLVTSPVELSYMRVNRALEGIKPLVNAALAKTLPASLGDCSSAGVPEPCTGDVALYEGRPVGVEVAGAVPAEIRVLVRWATGINTIKLTEGFSLRVIEDSPKPIQVEFRGLLENLKMSILVQRCILGACSALWDNADGCCEPNRSFELIIATNCSDDVTNIEDKNSRRSAVLGDFKVEWFNIDKVALNEKVVGIPQEVADLTPKVRARVREAISGIFSQELLLNMTFSQVLTRLWRYNSARRTQCSDLLDI